MSALKFIRDKTSLVVQAPSTGLEYEYPSVFFRDLKKPQLIIKSMYKNLTLAKNAFANSLRSSAPDLDAGKEFVYLYLKSKPMTNRDKWESYSVLVAEEETDVTVWDLFDTVLRNQTVPTKATVSSEQDISDVGLLVMFCSIYRMGCIFDSGYMGQVSDRIMTQAVGVPDDIPKPDALIALVGSWLNDANYLKMIAGIDMFLHRFPKSEFAQARVGTISSRYKDCASLLSIRFFLHVVGSDNLDDAPAWITYEPIALNLIRMSKIGEEAARGDSYFPYQSDMGLVRKSAYSTVVNPSYFFFVHGVGALLGLERSKNARMNLEYGLSGTVANVFLVAYVHKRNHVQALQFTASGEPVRVSGDNSDTEQDGITIRSNSPVKWAKFMSSREWVMTDFMKETIRRMQMELLEGETRAGTIGEFLSKHSID
ncbi:nucleoprotein [Gata virus]|uniref:Nucleoprotein n=1 Tax=Gata virus TaxID=1911435 RepID=A0A2Z2CP69_9RHAB|nr:nucleoprotein [Gata virus]AOX47529.1 nucleoprotein [Gata virus]